MLNHENIKVIDKYIIFLNSSLGKGSYGSVFRGLDKQSQLTVAVKQISLQFINKQKNSEQLFNSLKNEILSMKISSDPNIVNLLDVKKSSNNLYMVMEFCNQGSLEQYLLQKNKLSVSETISIMKQIVQGFKHLRTKNIVHRDLKPANILINDGLVKIADFGFAKIQESQENGDEEQKKQNQNLLKTQVGSPLYMSPQILKGQQYSCKCDVWSLGLIFYEMLYGDTPWTGASVINLYNNICNQALKFPELKSGCQQEGIEMINQIIRKMLQLEENERISWEELFQYEVFVDQKVLDRKWIKESQIIFQQNTKKDSLTQAKDFNQQYFTQNRVIRNIHQCYQKQNFNEQLIQVFNKYIYEQKIMKDDISENLSIQKLDEQIQKDTDFAQLLLDLIEKQKQSRMITKLIDWILYKRNKMIFVNNLACQFYDLVFQKKIYVKTHLFYRFLFVVFKYQKMILYKLYIRIKQGNCEKYDLFKKEVWELFTQSDKRNIIYKFIKNDLVVVEQFFMDILQKTTNYLDQKDLQNSKLNINDDKYNAKKTKIQQILNNSICDNKVFKEIFVEILEETEQNVLESIKNSQKKEQEKEIEVFQNKLKKVIKIDQEIKYGLELDFDKLYEDMENTH